MENRITDEDLTSKFINEVGQNRCFVFGSNEGGRHSLGAAKTAMGMGAKFGQASGIQGNTYGIPTKDKAIRRVLTLTEIQHYVDEFIFFAKNNPQITFYVTKIGCGLAGYKPKQIAPLFKEAVELKNVNLPAEFWHKLIK